MNAAANDLWNAVSFGPAEVRAVLSDGGASVPRAVRMAVLTSTTCGEPCWHAREEICRCSCGGANHGCLLVEGAASPIRTAKIGGERYRLAGVGMHADLIGQAKAINGRQWRAMEPAECVIGAESRNAAGERFTEAEIAAARAGGRQVWFSQYHYRWNETDDGAPARLKFATKEQIAKWRELAGWQARAREGVCLLWEIEVMPARPAVLRVSRDGVALANQSPIGEQV